MSKIPAFKVLKKDSQGLNSEQASEYMPQHEANMLALELSLVQRRATYGVAVMLVEDTYCNGRAARSIK